jgi:hypothetical protein
MIITYTDARGAKVEVTCDVEPAPGIAHKAKRQRDKEAAIKRRDEAQAEVDSYED